MYGRSILAAVATLFLASAPAQAERVANYFHCTLLDGKTVQELVAFKAEYEEAVEAAELDGYELRLQFAIYNDEIGTGSFVWEGSWPDFEHFTRTSNWFRASDWPARFDAMMTCDRSSLWRVVD